MDKEKFEEAAADPIPLRKEHAQHATDQSQPTKVVPSKDGIHEISARLPSPRAAAVDEEDANGNDVSVSSHPVSKVVPVSFETTTTGALEPSTGTITTKEAPHSSSTARTTASAQRSMTPSVEYAKRSVMTKGHQSSHGGAPVVRRLKPSTALEPGSSQARKDQESKQTIKSQRNQDQDVTARLRLKQEQNQPKQDVLTDDALRSGSSQASKDEQTKQSIKSQRNQEVTDRLRLKQERNQPSTAGKQREALESGVKSLTSNDVLDRQQGNTIESGGELSSFMKQMKGNVGAFSVVPTTSMEIQEGSGRRHTPEDDAHAKQSVIASSRDAEAQVAERDARTKQSIPSPQEIPPTNDPSAHGQAPQSESSDAFKVFQNERSANDRHQPPYQVPRPHEDTEEEWIQRGEFRARPGAFAIDLDPSSEHDSLELDDEWQQVDEQDPTPPPPEEDNIEEPAVLEAEIIPLKEECQGGGYGRKCFWLGIAGVAVLIVAVVVIVVVIVTSVGSDDGDSVGTLSPSISATVLQPTIAPSPALILNPWEECFSDTRTLLAALQFRDLDEFADVRICQNTLLRVGGGSGDSARPRVFYEPSSPLAAQSNMRIRCGEDGRVQNNCRVQNTGTIGALVQNSRWARGEDAAFNITFEGLTFESRKLLDLYNGGEITFRNCLFRRSGGSAPIEIDHESRPSLVRQTIIFESCVFENLQYGPNTVTYAESYSDTSTLILAGLFTNIVVFRDCIFRNNEVNGQLPGYLITSLGAEIRVEQSCFGTNINGLSASPILLGGDSAPTFVDGLNNYANDTWDCGFVLQRLVGETASCMTLTDTAVCSSTLVDFNAFW